MQKKWLVLAGIFLFLIPSVIAVQPEEKSTKIFGSPFYRATMTNNNEYNWTIPVKPPDGITSVLSAIVAFDVYLTPSVNFTIKVNGIPCNTYFYYVSTTYASAGQSRVTFDCSNRITKAGTYNVTIRPTGANTGSVSGWLDLTYMNKPETTVTVGGTEYSINETSNYTIFAQVPSINDAICEYSIFNTSRQKTMNGILTYISGSDGLYDMDFSNPNMLNPLVAGVYRIQVSCVRPIAPQSQVMHFNEYSSASFYHILENFTGTVSDLEYMSGSGTGEVCVNATFDDRWLERGQQFNRPSFVNNITNIVGYFRTSSGNTSALDLTMKFYKYNFYSNTYTLLNISSLQGQFINTTTKEYVLPNVIINTSWASEELMSVEVCCSNRGGREIRFYHNQSAVDSRFTRNIGGVNESVSFLYKGSGEIHVNSPLSVSANVTINLDDVYGNLTDIKNTQIQILGNLSSMTNYLITINDTTYQINQSQYQNYISLLAAINSVNATANQTLSYVVALNGSVFNLSIAELSHFQQIIALLNSINYTLNTTLEYKLDLINGTVMQINQSQTAYYLSLLGAINSLGATLNGTVIPYLVGISDNLTEITQYLVLINGTTFQINQSQFLYYTNLLQAINSANDTQNWQYLNLLSLLNSINATGNTTLELVASINQTLWDDIFVILKDINFTTNTTLEYKLDLINYTTWQSWVMLQNLTIGNVTVTASVNWTEGVPIIWNASGQSQVDYSLLSLSNEGIQLVVETMTCLGNTTLVHTMNVTNCVMGQCLDSVKNITESCAYGCANNMCVPAPTIQYFSILGVVLLIAGFTYVIWRAGGKG